MAQAFELNTTISNLRDLTESDLSPYDAVYLGNITCRLYEGNLLERLDDLREAIAIVKGRGQKAYVTTYAAPRNDSLSQLRKVVAVAVETGADAVEVHNLGVLKIIHEAHPDLVVHIGGFANVYTDVGAAVLKRYGAVCITPNYELSLEEIGEIHRQVELPMELLVHGKMPLGMSDDCFLLEYEQAWGVTCPTLCRQDLFLKQGDWAMKSIGKGVMSGKDVCLLEHLQRLMTEGHSCFRVEAASESPAYRLEIGQVYREALEAALAGSDGLEERWWDTIKRHARIGLCNGFYFGRSGMAYHGVRHPGADTAEARRSRVGQ
ncbi:peptidase U32 family protein [Candidatus Methylomirabilis sp.]|uniref:peptidase U32 family protein n=1 Tax=Candidatus Methylomirabilis sp. TaxID=2032687 RepID=UPI002A64CBC7|nr:U32 family peptidase [Candidatus Methylomirabilis sp.]